MDMMREVYKSPLPVLLCLPQCNLASLTISEFYEPMPYDFSSSCFFEIIFRKAAICQAHVSSESKADFDMCVEGTWTERKTQYINV